MPTSAEPPVSGTPILDRQTPLPPRLLPGSGLAGVLAVLFGVIAIVAAILLLSRPPIPADFFDWLRGPRTGPGTVGLVVAALGAFYAMIAIHELGHVLAGLGAGFRFRSVRFGPLLFSRPFRISLYRGPGAVTNGVAELIPVATDNLAKRGVAMVLGGPAANILTGIVVLALPLPMNIFTGCLFAFSMLNGLSDLVPFESRLGVSDGRRIWMLLRDRERGERWLALLRLGGELHDGVLPESMPAVFIAKGIAVRDPSADTVTAHALAYWVAFHQHRDEEAGQLLEVCLTYASHAAPVVREALMSDAAVFQARRRKRADLAEQWLAAIPAGTQHQWFRSRAEAAILEANGDIEGALRKLTEVETAILSSPKSAQRDVVLQLLRRWTSDLSRCQAV